MIWLENLREITPTDLATLGVNDIAFVKSVSEEGRVLYAIHAADGTQMAVVTSRELAMAAVRQHDLEPLDVH